VRDRKHLRENVRCCKLTMRRSAGGVALSSVIWPANAYLQGRETEGRDGGAIMGRTMCSSPWGGARVAPIAAPAAPAELSAPRKAAIEVPAPPLSKPAHSEGGSCTRSLYVGVAFLDAQVLKLPAAAAGGRRL
jgi:hypothetical protein